MNVQLTHVRRTIRTEHYYDTPTKRKQDAITRSGPASLLCDAWSADALSG